MGLVAACFALLPAPPVQGDDEPELVSARRGCDTRFGGCWLQVIGTPAADDITVRTGQSARVWIVKAEAGLSVGPGCLRLAARSAACRKPRSSDGYVDAYVDARAGDDEVRTSGDDGIQLYGAEGRDLLVGGQGDDGLQGGDGRDELHGRGGEDWLFGDHGRNRLFGGSADDRLYSSRHAADRPIDCGPGNRDAAYVGAEDPRVRKTCEEINIRG